MASPYYLKELISGLAAGTLLYWLFCGAGEGEKAGLEGTESTPSPINNKSNVESSNIKEVGLFIHYWPSERKADLRLFAGDRERVIEHLALPEVVNIKDYDMRQRNLRDAGATTANEVLSMLKQLLPRADLKNIELTYYMIPDWNEGEPWLAFAGSLTKTLESRGLIQIRRDTNYGSDTFKNIIKYIRIPETVLILDPIDRVLYSTTKIYDLMKAPHEYPRDSAATAKFRFEDMIASFGKLKSALDQENKGHTIPKTLYTRYIVAQYQYLSDVIQVSPNSEMHPLDALPWKPDHRIWDSSLSAAEPEATPANYLPYETVIHEEHSMSSRQLHERIPTMGALNNYILYNNQKIPISANVSRLEEYETLRKIGLDHPNSYLITILGAGIAYRPYSNEQAWNAMNLNQFVQEQTLYKDHPKQLIESRSYPEILKLLLR